MQEKSVCRGCGSAIRWITMKTGKHMPVEVEPIRLIVTVGGNRTGVTPGGEVIKGETAVGTQGVKCYAPHWARCTAFGKTKKTAPKTEQTMLEV